MLGLILTTTVLAIPGGVTYFRAIPTDTTLSLTWVRASSSNTTVIRYLTSTYPTDPTGVADNSTLMYSGTLYSHIETGLLAGTTYYMTAWGYDGTNYSANATAAHCVMTTYGTTDEPDDLPTPTLPSNFNQTPSDTAWYDRLQPFTGIIATFASDWGMPRNNAMLLLSTILMVALGVGTYVKTKNVFVAYAVLLAADLASIGMHVMYGWSIFVLIAIALGIWAVERSYQ